MTSELSTLGTDAAAWRAYEALLGTTPDLLYVFDLEHRFIYANRALLTMWGMTWEQAQRKTCLEIGYEPWHAAMHDAEIEQVIATRAPIRGDVPFPHVTDGVRIYDYIFAPVIGVDGQVEAIAGSTRDVTERRRHEQQMQLLVNELNHRVKNSLVMVQSLIRQSMRSASGLTEARDKIDARLLALSTTHDVLTRQSWHSADVLELTHTAIAPYESEPPRFRISGQGSRVEPRKAVALSMALHELCTNALKYGALSVPGGWVDIDWRFERDAAGAEQVVLCWREREGPQVAAPEIRGFGSRLLEQGLRHDLGGEVSLDFAPKGVAFKATVPLQDADREVAHA